MGDAVLGKQVKEKACDRIIHNAFICDSAFFEAVHGGSVIFIIDDYFSWGSRFSNFFGFASYNIFAIVCNLLSFK